MYLTESIINGLRILGFDRETIKKVSKEKSLEEIFLSTLFLNYLIVLVVFLISLSMGGIQIKGRELNMPIFFGLLMIYPFAFNVAVYLLYGLFGFFAELLNSHKKIKPLISTGFHTAIVYSILFYTIGIVCMFDPVYASFLLGIFIAYFVIVMFLSITTIYKFSSAQTMITLLIPLLIIFTLLLGAVIFVDLKTIVGFFIK